MKFCIAALLATAQAEMELKVQNTEEGDKIEVGDDDPNFNMVIDKKAFPRTKDDDSKYKDLKKTTVDDCKAAARADGDCYNTPTTENPNNLTYLQWVAKPANDGDPQCICCLKATTDAVCKD